MMEYVVYDNPERLVVGFGLGDQALSNAVVMTPSVRASAEEVDRAIDDVKRRHAGLKEVVVAGVGQSAIAGQTFAALSSKVDRVLLVDPEVLGYLDDERPSTCNGDYVDESCQRGSSYTFERAQEEACPFFSNYTMSREAASRFVGKEVTYVADENGSAPKDLSCAALVQGPAVYQRCEAYSQYMHDVHGVPWNRHRFQSVSGCRGALSCVMSQLDGTAASQPLQHP